MTGAGFIVKLLGAAYRIPLSRLIGAEGIGLYQMAYPVYLIFLSLSTAGLPIAISRITAEQIARGNFAGVKQVFRASVLLLSGLGVAGSLAMALSARWLADRVVADPRAVFAMWALAPAVFFMSLIAAFRGFFQGQQEMAPSAGSQVVEQAVRVGVALILAVVLLGSGVEHAAAGAAFGATAGGAAGLVFLILIYWKRRSRLKRFSAGRSGVKLSAVINRLIRFALPISVAVILMPLLQTLDSLIVPAKLQSIGYTVQESTSMLGILGNSWAVLYLPMIVTGAIGSNLVPAITSALAVRARLEVKRRIHDGLRLAVIYLIPAAAGTFLLGGTIYRIIYGVNHIHILSWLAPAILFLGLEQVSASVLQGLGKPKLPLGNFTLGAVVKVIVTLAATGMPGLNLAGAALGTVCCSGLTAFLNLLAIKRMVPVRLAFITPALFAGCAMIGAGWYMRRLFHLHYLLEFCIVGLLSVASYGLVLWILGGITAADREVIAKLFRKKETG